VQIDGLKVIFLEAVVFSGGLKSGYSSRQSSLKSRKALVLKRTKAFLQRQE